MSQTTLPSPGKPVPGAPQQSLVLRQRSPSTLQPLAGWQIFTPVGPYGAHSLLQHLLQASQSVPSTPSLQNVGPDGGGPHFPIVAPAAIEQMPPQQSAGAEQASPVCTQNDEFEQMPLRQSFEQHSSLDEHALPSVLQLGLSGAHLPFVHEPPQQAAPLVHGSLSLVQVAAHCPPTQLNEQQSVLPAQLPPAGTQFPPPTVGAHVWLVASHKPEQQSPPAPHALPVAPHVGPEPPVPMPAPPVPDIAPPVPDIAPPVPDPELIDASGTVPVSVVAPPQPATARNPHVTKHHFANRFMIASLALELLLNGGGRSSERLSHASSISLEIQLVDRDARMVERLTTNLDLVSLARVYGQQHERLSIFMVGGVDRTREIR